MILLTINTVMDIPYHVSRVIRRLYGTNESEELSIWPLIFTATTTTNNNLNNRKMKPRTTPFTILMDQYEALKKAALHSSTSLDEFNAILAQLPPPSNSAWRQKYLNDIVLEALDQVKLRRKGSHHIYVAKLLLLVEHDPECVRVKSNREGAKLLHLACRVLEFPLHMIELLLEIDPDSIHERDDNGWLPFHCACSQLNLRLMNFLLDYYPEAAEVEDSRGRLPIHLVCHFGSSPQALYFQSQNNKKTYS